MEGYHMTGAFGVFTVDADTVGADDKDGTLCMFYGGANRNDRSTPTTDCSVMSLGC